MNVCNIWMPKPTKFRKRPMIQPSQRHPLPDESGSITSTPLCGSSLPITPVSGDLLPPDGLYRYSQTHSIHSHRHTNALMTKSNIIFLKVNFCIPRKCQMLKQKKWFTDIFLYFELSLTLIPFAFYLCSFIR